MSVTAFCTDWHIGVSTAFRELVVDPLRPYATIELTAWDGKKLPHGVFDKDRPCIFCHVDPPEEVVRARHAKLVWLPMWDHIWDKPQEWWNALPKSLRVVAFSKRVAEMALKADLPTLALQYFKDPCKTEAVRWGHERSLFYWNRTGMVGPVFLERMCSELKIDRLLFRGQVDPLFAAGSTYHLPLRLGRTLVEEVPGHMPKDGYMRLLGRTNVVIAPRTREGVGMTTLESLMRGCAVFAYDAPTMNEYITHRENGYLLPPFQPSKQLGLLFSLHNAVRWRLPSLRLAARPSLKYPVTAYQDWATIRALDLEGIGAEARRRCQEGFAEWEKRIAEYADFVLNWRST